MVPTNAACENAPGLTERRVSLKEKGGGSWVVVDAQVYHSPDMFRLPGRALLKRLKFVI